MREDALRNRERLVLAAKDIMRTAGVEASLDLVAKQAGVGNATLYRHFPSRQDLLREVAKELEHELNQILDVAERNADGWQGLVCLMEGVCALLAGDLGRIQIISRLFVTQFPEDNPATRIDQVTETLLLRGQQQGSVRLDLSTEDVLIMRTAIIRGVAALPAFDGAWRRQLALAMDGFRPAGAHELPGRDLSMAQIRQALTQL